MNAISLAPLLFVALVLGAPLAASATAGGDSSRVRPNGTVCHQVQHGPDDWYAGPDRFTVCRTIGTAPGQPEVATPARVARLPRR